MDLEQKMNEHKSLIKKVAFYSIIGISAVMIITGLVLTIVKKGTFTPPINEIRGTFSKEEALKNTKLIDFKIKILDKQILNCSSLTFKIDCTKENNFTYFYQEDEKNPIEIKNDDASVKLKLEYTVLNIYERNFDYSSLFSNLYEFTSTEDKCLKVINKHEGSKDFLQFSKYGVLTKGYIENKFILNAGN